MAQKIRVVLAKPGLDGHDRGAKIIAQALRDAGMEVIYTGIRQTPQAIVNAVLQEDAAVLGLSILSGAHIPLMEKLIKNMKKENMDDVLVLGGGVIPDEDISGLKDAGISEIFTPGTSMQEVVAYIKNNLVRK